MCNSLNSAWECNSLDSISVFGSVIVWTRFQYLWECNGLDSVSVLRSVTESQLGCSAELCNSLNYAWESNSLDSASVLGSIIV